MIFKQFLIGILGFINTFNVKLVSKIQAAFTISKIAALIIIISAGIWYTFNSISNNNEIQGWIINKKDFKLSKIALSLYSGLYTYSGWFVISLSLRNWNLLF